MQRPHGHQKAAELSPEAAKLYATALTAVPVKEAPSCEAELRTLSSGC